MTHSSDFLPMTSHVSALVRRITMRLSAYLAFHQHMPVTPEEGIAMFDLADASMVLDRIACLPGMGQAEERARRDLLDLYDVFQPVDLEATQEQPRYIHRIPGTSVNITEDLAAGRPIVILGPGGGGGGPTVSHGSNGKVTS